MQCHIAATGKGGYFVSHPLLVRVSTVFMYGCGFINPPVTIIFGELLELLAVIATAAEYIFSSDRLSKGLQTPFSYA